MMKERRVIIQLHGAVNAARGCLVGHEWRRATPDHRRLPAGEWRVECRSERRHSGHLRVNPACPSNCAGRRIETLAGRVTNRPRSREKNTGRAK